MFQIITSCVNPIEFRVALGHILDQGDDFWIPDTAAISYFNTFSLPC